MATINGNNSDNTLFDTLDADIINGRGGNDAIYSGTGADSIFGGTGTDYAYVDRSTATADFAFTFDGASDATVALGDGTTLTDIENLDIYLGSGNDTVTMVLSPSVVGDQNVFFGAGTDRAVIDASGFATAVGVYGGGSYYTAITDVGTCSISDVETLEVYGGSGDDYVAVTDGNDILWGNAGNDTIYAGTGEDSLYGGADNDALYVYGGDADAVDGGTGTDYAYVDRSTATADFAFTFDGASDATVALGDGTTLTDIENLDIYLGSGNDTVTMVLSPSATGSQYVYFGAGTDRAVIDASGFATGVGVYGGFGTTYSVFTDVGSYSMSGVETLEVYGGSGDDSVGAHDGNDSLSGNAGNDVLYGGAGEDSLYGGADNDVLYVYDGGADVVDGGTGTDYAYVDRSTATADFAFTFDGTSDATVALGDGTTLTDIENLDLYLGSGNDTVTFVLPPSATADQYVSFGDGTDRVVIDASGYTTDLGVDGGGSYYTVFLGMGFVSSIDSVETLEFYGGSGDDYVAVTDGNDSLSGNAGNDTIYAGAGEDSLYGGIGNDVLYGVGGDNSLTGGKGDDSLYGDTGNDRLIGSKGADLLIGFDGKDVLNGSEGSDTLSGGAGKDKLTGGLGKDVFLFNELRPSGEADTIEDFTSGEDKFNFQRSAFAGIAFDPAGKLRAAEFTLGDVATTTAHRFAYDSTTGNLWYDEDGTGAVGPVLVSTLTPGAVLLSSDIFLL